VNVYAPRTVLLEEGDLVVDADGCDQGDDDTRKVKVAKAQWRALVWSE
jgi:hypothetical protein